MPETLEESVSKWILWLEQLRGELIAIFVDKLMFEELYEAVRISGTTSGDWLNHYQRLYVSKQTMAVRRISRGDGNTISLTSLFREIKARHFELTENWLRELITSRASPSPANIKRTIDNFHDEWCQGGDFVSEVAINADAQLLGRKVNIVREWADITIAHLNQENDGVPLTWGELNSSFETIAEIIIRYKRLLTRVDEVLPPEMPLSWRDPFGRILFSASTDIAE